MRRLVGLMLLIPLVNAALAAEPDPPEDTQLGMNQDAGVHLRATEAEMKSVLAKLSKRAAKDPSAAEKIRPAQCPSR
jgi:hypothetical protein